MMLTCKCASCLKLARERPQPPWWSKDGTFGCGADKLIDPVMLPLDCPHCGSRRVDPGRTGLHMCEACSGLFREQDRQSRLVTERQDRIEEALR